MASLSGVSRSNSISSLMNSANTITGLASGLDTESMIENLVKSYQAKINQLNQKVTKVEWKQDAYRSIISKMVSFADKYTSYTSSTNLMSRGFFSNAVTVSALGKYADRVSATGKSSSDISLDSVQQLAKAAQYRTKGNLASENTGTISGKEVDLFGGDDIELSNLSGSMTLTYGSKTVKLSFDETEDMEAINNIRKKLGDGASDAEVLAELINQKLADKQITFTNGNTENADQRIKATADADGKITFSELGKAGNGVYISGASGNIADQLGLSSSALKNASKNKITTIDTNKMTGPNGEKGLTRTLSGLDYLTEKSGSAMSFTLDGVTKSISLPKIEVKQEKELVSGSEEDGDAVYETVTNYYVGGKKAATVGEGEEISAEQQDALTTAYKDALQESLDKAFGTTKNEAGETESKIKVENLGEGGSLKLKFTVDKNSELSISGAAGDALGIGKNATSYLTTDKTLEDLLGDKLEGLEAKDKDGNVLKDKNGNTLYDFVLNGEKIGSYTKDATLQEIMNDINNNEAAGMKVAYSQTTKSFTFTSKETGAESKVEMGEGLASAMFGISVSGEDKVSDTFKGLDLKEDEWQRLAVETASGGTLYFSVNAQTTMDDIVEEVKYAFQAEGYTVSYDNTTGKLVATNEDDGSKLDIKLSKATHIDDGSRWGKDVTDEELEYKNDPKISYTAGQDAKFTMTINGEEMEMTRSTNTVNIDGLNITMKDTFTAENAGDAVTFKTNTDSDKIIDVIKEMVNDYNTMMLEIKSAYSTMPYQNSNGSFGSYQPLTEEDMEGMSESAIARYEEKAKQGLLFGDQTLSSLYDKLNQAFSFSNKADVDALKDMGISVSFNKSDGTQAVTIDEDKLRAMLDSDPDKVANLFTKSDGIMDRMKTQLDNYAKTVGEPKGILIQQAGSPLSSLSLMNNQWQSEIDNYNTQIEKWQTKLQSQVERYTSQFSRLEQLIAQMNNQSSTLAGLMGG